MTKVLLTLLLVLAGWSCTSSPADPDAASAVDPDFERVREVSPDLASLGLALEREYAGQCGARNRGLSGSIAERLSLSQRERLRERWDAGCDLLSEVVAERRAVAASVVATRVVPIGLLTFPLYRSYCEDDRPDGLILTSLVPITIQVGPFRDVEACDASALSFRSAGLDSEGCRVWQPNS